MEKKQSGTYWQKKNIITVIIGIAAAAVLIVLAVAAGGSDDYEYISELVRPDRGEILYELEVIQGGSIDELQVYVGGKVLTDEELEQVFAQAEKLLEERFLGENEGMDMIENPVSLINTLPEYDMQVRWYIEDREVIDYWGNIYQGNEEKTTTVIATLVYEKEAGEGEEKSREYIYKPKVRPYSERQLHNMEIKEIFDKADADSANSDSVLLPQSHNGRKLQYRIKKKNEVFRFILIIPLIIAVVIVEKRSMQAGRKKKLQEELTREYPEIISKLSLLTGAGMTPYNALKRIAADGNGEAYSRLAAVVGNIQSGASERSQYASFGRIFGLGAYSRLGSMLEQNAVKGNERLRIMLREECEQALEERKARARKAGEQAGTKMLFPMMLMLLIVMVVIMVPAFMSM